MTDDIFRKEEPKEESKEESKPDETTKEGEVKPEETKVEETPKEGEEVKVEETPKEEPKKTEAPKAEPKVEVRKPEETTQGLYLKVKQLNPKSIIPSKREEDAGYDLYGVFEEEFQVLQPGEVTLIPTGLAVQIPIGWVLYVAERGSTGSKGIARRCGVVDSGYRGEIFVATNNTSNKTVIFAKNDGPGLAVFLQKNNYDPKDVTVYLQKKAVAQAMLLNVGHARIEIVDELDNNSERGTGALGSSGK